MNKKYELIPTDKTAWNGEKLFQIKANISFGSVKKNELGGYIAKEENLSHDGNAWVYGNAKVYGNARVSGDAKVSGDAWVYGNARVYGNAWVYGNAEVYGNAWVYGNARVSGDAKVSGDALVYGNAKVSGNARVYGNARVSAKKAFTKGWFIGGDNSGEITDITEQTGSDYWKNQYVLGDYKIKDIEEDAQQDETIIELNGKKYKLVESEQYHRSGSNE